MPSYGRRKNTNSRTIMLAIASVAIIIACPCLSAIESDAEVIISDDQTALASETYSIEEMRMTLESAGYSVDGLSDEEIEERFGWFANKNLIGKYAWNDPTGVNWLLREAGVNTTVDAIDAIGDTAQIVIGDVSVIIGPATIPVELLIELGLIIVNFYDDTMKQNALDKAEVALELISQQKNYAVYETTVLWDVLPNGYEVEEW